MEFLATGAVVASVLVLAYQARELTKQTRQSNQVAATEARRELTAQFREILLVFVEHPSLRAHFYGEAPHSPAPDEQAQLEALAEVYADALQTVLDTTEQLRIYGWVPATWRRYAEVTIRNSPALQSLLHTHPGLWPPLDQIVAGIPAAHAGSAVTDKEPP